MAAPVFSITAKLLKIKTNKTCFICFYSDNSLTELFKESINLKRPLKTRT